MQDVFFKLHGWYLYGLILIILQIIQTAYGISSENFYRITPYEENYILPLHYILTQVELDGQSSDISNLKVERPSFPRPKRSIPLPIPELTEAFLLEKIERAKRNSVKDFINYRSIKRKSELIQEQYPFTDPKEVAFQTSFKVPLLLIPKTQTQFYFGYTARSWWQCYTGISAFFREIEQKADFFVEQPFFISSTRRGNTNLYFEKLKIGFLHHSNGEGLDFECSCNRVYVALFMKWFTGRNKWGLILKRWRILDTPDKRFYNPDIESFLGDHEITVNFEGRFFQWTIRKQLNSIQCLVNFPFSPSLRGLIYYFNGYGSTIGLYKTPYHTVGIGFQAKH